MEPTQPVTKQPAEILRTLLATALGIEESRLLVEIDDLGVGAVLSVQLDGSDDFTPDQNARILRCLREQGAEATEMQQV